MNYESYEQLIASAKTEATEALGHSPSPQRLAHVLDVFAQRVAAATRDYHLTNLMSAEQAAQQLGVQESAVRRLLIRRNLEAPLGQKVGKNTWIIDIDELPMLREDRRHKHESHS